MFSDQVASVLQVRKSMSIEEIARDLFGAGFKSPEVVTAIERTLFAGHRRFQRSRCDPQRWSLTSIHADDSRSISTGSGRWDTSVFSQSARTAAFARAREMLPAPYSWQLEALEAWKMSGRRGIVEAVTGSGKTMVGILAMLDALEGGSKVHIIVPTIDLQRQWLVRIRNVLPHQTAIGRCGGGFHADLQSVDVLVSVVNSVRRSDVKNATSGSDLIIADECHRLASGLNSIALDSRFLQRLGLSATYRRDDNGHTKFLLPYFEQVCYSLDYERARLDTVIADFGVVFVGVGLSDAESEEYQWLSNEISSLFGSFYRLLRQDIPDYPALIEVLLDSASGKYSHVDERIEEVAKVLLVAMRRRRRLLEFAEGKLDALVALGPEIRASGGTVVFTQSIDVALSAAAALNGAGVNSVAVHSRTDNEVRRFHIRKFASGDLQAIVAPRILDEGIDFPDADLAVVLAASNSRRQMIQRMGRVLRPKEGGRKARFAVLFVEDTVEDPRFGAHGIFRQDIDNSANVLGIVLHDNYPEALQLLGSLRIGFN